MIVLHYAGITNNEASGVSVVVPQIVNYMAQQCEVALYNFSDTRINLDDRAVFIENSGDFNYCSFAAPFNNPDLVFFHSPFGIPKINCVARKLRKDKIPYIVVPHGCFSKPAMRKKWLKKQIALKVFFKACLKNADAVQYLCENEKKDSVLTGKSIIVSNGVSVPKSNIKKFHENKRFVFIGRKDIYHKGIDVLLEGCFLIKEKLEESGVVIELYGPGSKADLNSINESIEKKGIGKIVFNCGPIFGTEKKEVLKASDLFILTSRYEGQPFAILEAMSYALPVLVTPGTGFFDEIEKANCGYAVNFSAKDIADALLVAAYDKEKISLFSKNAYNYVKDVYSWEKVIERGMTIYKDVCDEKDCWS